MNQTKLESMIETIINIASGFIISLFVWEFVAMSYLGFDSTHAQTFMITSIFTAISVARGYFWRRFFNRGLHKFVHKQLAKLF